MAHNKHQLTPEERETIGDLIDIVDAIAHHLPTVLRLALGVSFLARARRAAVRAQDTFGAALERDQPGRWLLGQYRGETR